ncbi:hypothetical protein LZ023_39570 (plasmid) [Pseudomonas silvicola]|nr:hypothetical protein LZ023_39570 [Pseudomonas silvicola]
MKALTLSFTPLAVWRRWFRSLEVVLGSLLLAIVLLMAYGRLVSRYPLEMVAQPFLWPGDDAQFPLGTDSLGRNVAAGIFHGARVSLQIGTIAVMVSVVIGLIAGGQRRLFRWQTDRTSRVSASCFRPSRLFYWWWYWSRLDIPR